MTDKGGSRVKSPLKNKIFLSFVLSYIFVLMIPYGIGYFVYDQSVNMLSEKINQVESAALHDRVEIIDFKVSSFISTLTQLIDNGDLSEFIDNDNPYGSGDGYYTMTQLKQQMSLALLNNHSIKNITIYSKKNNRILSSSFGTVYNGIDSFPYHELWGVTKSDFDELLQQEGIKYNFMTNLKTGEKNIFISMPIIITDVAEPEGLLIAEMTSMSDLMNTDEEVADTSAFIIVNGKNQIISSYSKGLIEVAFDLNLLDNSRESSSEVIEKGEYLLTYQPSSVNGWMYISMIDMANYLKDIDEYKKLVIVYVLFSSLVGIIIAFYISRLKYKPINRLKMIASSYKEQSNNHDNDYQFIESSIDNMIHTVDLYKIHMLKQERKNISWYFNRIIRGWHIEMDSDFDSQELVDIKTRIEESKNRVLIYQIDDFMETFYEVGMDFKQESTIGLVSFVLTNVLEEFFGEFGAQHALSLDNDNRFIIPVIITNEEIDFAEKAKMIKDFLMKKFGIIGSFAISGIHQGKIGIKNGYDEAVDVMEFRGIIGDQNTVCTYDSLLSEKGNRKLMFRIEKEKIFVNFILVEDFKEAKKTIYNILDEDVAEVKSLQILKVKLFGMIDKMMYGLMSLSERSEYYGTINQEQLDQLLNALSIPELKRIIDVIFNQLIRIKEDCQQGQEGQQKIKEILDYVCDNVTNPDLNVSMIAEKFDMTVSNLSKYIKKELGQCALDYIHLIRIQKSKKMLLDTKSTLAEIAKEVGYYNYRTLVSRFKKYEGVTPTQYRDKVQ